ncbi:Mor transcription activator family protein [Glaesserella parasuis]|nr:Mor transcription activator family protein [Glaesserella parasuis]
MCEFENVEEYLPDSVREIVAVIGLPATEKFVKAFGGFSFQFSKSAKYFDKLREVLGQEDAVKLQSYMQVGEVYIPRCETALRILRNQQLYADFCHLTETEKLSGRMAIMRLCQKYQICDRTAWEVVRYYQRYKAVSQSVLF